MSGSGQIVTLGCGEDLFAVPVDRVQEILDLCPIAPLPHAPGHLLGLIDVRGDSVAVADLRTLLGLPPVTATAATRIIVLSVLKDGRHAVIALKADRVIEVTGLDDDQIGPVPEASVFNWEERVIAGIGRRNGGFVTVLDLDRMFEGLSLGTAVQAA